ncbi:MAG: SWIM zinc finger family protein [Chloroflexota bacterium]
MDVLKSFYQRVIEENYKDAASRAVFNRGKRYFNEGAVELESFEDEHLNFTVEGSYLYFVNIYDDWGELNYDCDCPYFENHYICKHLIAVLLFIESQVVENKVSSSQWQKKLDQSMAYFGGFSGYQQTQAKPFFTFCSLQKELSHRYMSKETCPLRRSLRHNIHI